MNIIAISGPSAAGKDAIIRALLYKSKEGLSLNLEKANYMATRKLRPGEVAGQDIITCSEKDFDLIVENKDGFESQSAEIIFDHIKSFIKETENETAKS